MTRIIKLKGGAGSGNWGHGGRPGKLGGSAPKSFVMSIRSGRDAAQRQAAAKTGKTASDTEVLRPLTPVSVDEARLMQQLNYKYRYGDDEAMRDFMNGGAMGSAGPHTNWMNSTPDERSETKRDIANQVYDKIPDAMKAPAGFVDDGVDAKNFVTKDAVAGVVTQWAQDSNDSNTASLSVQEAASQEFKVPMSKFQQDSIVKTIGVAGGEYRPGLIADHQRASNMTREAERAILRAQYNNTQTQLAAAGYKPTDTVRLYRGLNFGENAPAQGAANYQGNALESWSISPYTAANFAVGSWENGARVVVANVPISSIFSTARTGNGCLNEGECVVFGSLAGSQVTVVDKSGVDRSGG